MMQRGGNALGVAVLGVPFFTLLGRAMADGVDHPAAYVRAFVCVVCWIVAMLVVVLGLLTSRQVRRHSDCTFPKPVLRSGHETRWTRF